MSHVVGSGQHARNWKRYWEAQTGRNFPQRCQIYNCGNQAQMGAHVYVKFKRQNFILPTCQSCNKDPAQEYGRGWASAKANAMVAWVERHENTYE